MILTRFFNSEWWFELISFGFWDSHLSLFSEIATRQLKFLDHVVLDPYLSDDMFLFMLTWACVSFVNKKKLSSVFILYCMCLLSSKRCSWFWKVLSPIPEESLFSTSDTHVWQTRRNAVWRGAEGNCFEGATASLMTHILQKRVPRLSLQKMCLGRNDKR